MEVFVIGAGYVGLTLGVVLAECGSKVSFIDINEEVVQSINQRMPLFFEDGLEERMRTAFSARGQIAYKEIPSAIESPSSNIAVDRVFVVTLGTPLDTSHKADLVPIHTVFTELSEYIRESDLVILRSTVAVGTTSQLRKCFPKIKMLAFCPERTVEGAALDELTELPQIISGSDSTSLDAAASFFRCLGVTCVPMASTEAAEMVKLASNSYRDVTFAFANVLAQIAHTHGVNIEEVIQAANFRYERNRIPMPGLVGGPCLEKDAYILSQSLKSLQSDNLLIASRSINETFVKFASIELEKMVKRSGATLRVLVCGLAFKGRPMTSDTRGSLVYRLLSDISSRAIHGVEFDGLDPLVQKFSGLKNIYSKIAEVNFDGYDLIIQMTNHEVFEEDAFCEGILRSNARLVSFWPVSSMFDPTSHLLLGGTRL